MPVATVRPTYDVAAFARESEERMAIASFVPTTPAPGAPEEKVSIPKSDAPSEELRALVEEDPRD